MHLIHTIYEPEGPGPHPTVLALHGWGANGFDLLSLAPHLCGGKLMVVCPQGPLEVPIGPGIVGFGWFPFSLGGTTDLQTILSARDQLRAFLDDCLARYPADKRKVIALGFSQGGAMAYSLALADPKAFAGVVVASSWLPQELAERFSAAAEDPLPPALIQHGSRDDLIPVERARSSVEALRNLRVPVTYREYDMGHEISARSLGDISGWLQEKVLSPIVLAK